MSNSTINFENIFVKITLVSLSNLILSMMDSGVLFTNGTGSNSESNILLEKREPVFIGVCLYSEMQNFTNRISTFYSEVSIQGQECVCVLGW